ncbi:hypothetical protein BC941DRAFT_414424 [Chlamydoabsidia padenii]|nr:hypothetical protein BC941DRAFT_414424 [Chlamydoabsidia padenii]
MDSFRARDTDSWSVAATIDDQESVISVQGGLVGLSGSTTTLDTIHDSSIDETSSLPPTNNSSPHITTIPMGGHSDLLLHQQTQSRQHVERQLDMPLETLRDLDDHTSTTTGDDEDKRSRSNAAEFGDDGTTRSAVTDFDDIDSGDNNDSDQDSSIRGEDDQADKAEQQQQQQQQQQQGSCDGGNGQDTHHQSDHHNNRYHHRRQRQHHVVNDSIAAPPQPQPSFTPVTKSYVELLEENDILQSQIHNLQITQKHQAQVIDNLRSLTECSERVFDKAINLSQLTTDEQKNILKASQAQQPEQQEHAEHPQLVVEDIGDTIRGSTTTTTTTTTLVPVSTATPTTTINIPPVVYAHTITELLERLSDRVHQFVIATVDQPWQLVLEQHLFTAITDAYLVALPFGTDNQQLLNTAYRDQLRRFQSTLGSSFAQWYRRQTVQSLSLNPATKEYLEQMQEKLTIELMQILAKHDMRKSNQLPLVDQEAWADVLQWCRNLSLEIHGGEADVIAQPITPGIDYDSDIMTVVATGGNDNPTSDNITKGKKVKFVVSPLFIDEDDRVLLTARVLLD